MAVYGLGFLRLVLGEYNTEFGEEKGMKRVTVISAITALGLSVATGCTGSGDRGETAPQPSGQTAEQSAPAGSRPSYYSEQPAQVTMFIPNQETFPHDPKAPAWQWIKEETNITVKASIPAGQETDAYNLMMASGDITDIVHIDRDQAVKYGQAGAFVNFLDHLDRMPNVKKFWELKPQFKSMATDPQGKVYSLLTDGVGYTNARTWMYRDDVFAKHNLQAPATWEELYQVSKRLKELYPDTYPFAFRSQLVQLNVLGSAFETFNGYFPDFNTGKVKYGPIDPNFKEMVVWLNKFYAEGLIPPDWLSMETKNWAEYITTNKAFITVDYIVRIEYLNNLFKDGGQSGHMKFMPPPAGPSGKQWILNGAFSLSAFSVYAGSPNLDTALKYLDFLYSEKAFDLMSWGKEGETYEIKDGKRQYITSKYKDLLTLRAKTNIMTNGAEGWLNPEAFMTFTPEAEMEVYREGPKYVAPKQIIPPIFDESEQEIISTVGEAVKKASEESISKFILGQRPIGEWDTYVQEIEKLGVQKVIDLYQKGWDRQK